MTRMVPWMFCGLGWLVAVFIVATMGQATIGAIRAFAEILVAAVGG